MERGERVLEFTALADTCAIQGWTLELASSRTGPFRLEVRQDGDLLARAVRRSLRDAAVVCCVALEKSGRLQAD